MGIYSSSIFVCAHAIVVSACCILLSHINTSIAMDSEQRATAAETPHIASAQLCVDLVNAHVASASCGLSEGRMLLFGFLERTRMRAQYLPTTASCTLARLASMSDMPSAASCAEHSGCEARLPKENRAIFAGEPASLASLADSRTSRIKACAAESISRSAGAPMCSTCANECAAARLRISNMS